MRPGRGLQSEAPAVPGASRTLESLILGHLPALASPWAAQFAATAAEREGRCVALVRLASGQALVELFGSESADTPGSAGDLPSALRLAAAQSGRWIIRVDAPDEPSVARHAGVSTVTVLCSSDEAAVVGAYRAIKSFAGPAEAEPSEDSRPEGVTLRVAIMGAGGEKADRAASRLRQAAHAFLDRPLEATPPIERLGPTRPMRLFQGAIEGGADALLGHVTTALASASTPIRHELSPGLRGWSNSAPESKDPPLKTHEQLRVAGVGPVTLPGSQESNRAPAEIGADVLLHAAPETPDGAGAALTVRVAGLTPLGVRCPYDESVEIAIDGAGGVHVLARAGTRALESLQIVADWTLRHAELIAMASSEARRLDAACAPTMHLFTERPADIRRLLDTRVKAHVLAPVTVDGRTGWFCVDLN